MRTLIYAMQSSGASLFSYWLSQQESCLGVVDLYFDQISPSLEHDNIVLKCVATKEFTLEDHKSAFKPDKVILFTRNPVANYLSLSEKQYCNWGGTIDQKFKIFDQCIENEKFDLLVKYEDFIMKKSLGVGDPSFYSFNKTITDVIQYNSINNDWCRLNYKKKWGIGNIHANNLNSMNIDDFPNLKRMYGE